MLADQIAESRRLQIEARNPIRAKGRRQVAADTSRQGSFSLPGDQQRWDRSNSNSPHQRPMKNARISPQPESKLSEGSQAKSPRSRSKSPRPHARSPRSQARTPRSQAKQPRSPQPVKSPRSQVKSPLPWRRGSTPRSKVRSPPPWKIWPQTPPSSEIGSLIYKPMRLSEELPVLAASGLQREVRGFRRACVLQRENLRSQTESLQTEAARLNAQQVVSFPSRPNQVPKLQVAMIAQPPVIYQIRTQPSQLVSFVQPQFSPSAANSPLLAPRRHHRQLPPIVKRLSLTGSEIASAKLPQESVWIFPSGETSTASQEKHAGKLSQYAKSQEFGNAPDRTFKIEEVGSAREHKLATEFAGGESDLNAEREQTPPPYREFAIDDPVGGGSESRFGRCQSIANLQESEATSLLSAVAILKSAVVERCPSAPDAAPRSLGAPETPTNGWARHSALDAAPRSLGAAEITANGWAPSTVASVQNPSLSSMSSTFGSLQYSQTDTGRSGSSS